MIIMQYLKARVLEMKARRLSKRLNISMRWAYALIPILDGIPKNMSEDERIVQALQVHQDPMVRDFPTVIETSCNPKKK